MELIDPSIDLRHAIDRLEQGRTGEAEVALATLLKVRPDNGEAWYYRGRVLQSNGDLDGALASAAKATELVPDWSLPWEMLAEVYQKRNQPDKAIHALEKVCALDAGWIEIRRRLAAAYWRAGRRGAALEVLDRMLAADPHDEAARALRGVFRILCRRFDDANADLAPQIGDPARLKALDGTTVLFAARLARLRGDAEEALRIAQHALTRTQLDMPCLIKFGRLALVLGDAELAYKFGAWACRVDPGNSAANFLSALSSEGRGDIALAVFHLRRACEARPMAFDWKYLLGTYYMRQNQLAMAEIMFDAVLGRDPDRLPARVALARILLRRGDAFGALQVAEAGLDRTPDSIELMIAVARALADLDRLDEALRLLREACRIAPDSGDAAFALGDKLAQAEQWLEAERSLAHARELMPLDRRVEVALGTCRARLGRSIDDLEMSTAFSLQAHAPRTRGWSAGWQALLLHLRTVEAVCLRDIRIRFGREKLGYLWAFIEPLMFVAVFYGLFLAVNRHVPTGMTTLSFLISGVIPWVMFSNTYGRVSSAVVQNRTLLYFPQVKPIDLFAARALLELFTIFVVFLVLMLAVHVIQPLGPIGDILEIVDALFVAWLLGIGLGLIVMSILTVVKSFDKIMGYVIRLIFFTAGIFFLPNEMPRVIQEILMFNPMLHVIDRMREGLFVDYHAVDTDFSFALGVAVVMLFFGLLGESVIRARPD